MALDAFPTFVVPLRHWRAIGLDRAREGYVRVANGMKADAFVTPVVGIPEGVAWTGGWWSRSQRGPMACMLIFEPNGVLRGGGKDKPGHFVLTGSWEDDGRVSMMKSYGSHVVDYVGRVALENGVFEGAVSVKIVVA